MPAEPTDRMIWTLDARNNGLLPAMSDYLNLTNVQLRREIVIAHQKILAILRAKGVDYNTLGAALVPQTKRLEYAFVFDREKIDEPFYGEVVGAQILPLLNRQLTCSILSGDLIHPGFDSATALNLLERCLQPRRISRITDTYGLYCIYLNNLTPNMAHRIHAGLMEYGPYVGFIQTTFASPMKSWLSFVLVRTYLKTKDRMLCSHEDDVPNGEDSNLPSWPLDAYGYQCLSMQSVYYNLFLAYKIERPVHPVSDIDTKYSLSAISDSPLPLEGLTIAIAEEKAQYLRDAKAGSMAIGGVKSLTTSQLRKLIASKIDHNYIYNLRFLAEHNVSLFNIVLEVVNPNRITPVKLMAAFEYRPTENLLRLVTLF